MSRGVSLSGVIPVVQTPFHVDGELDFGSLGSEIEWIFEQGASGVTVGMVSEILRLSTNERYELAEQVCDSVKSTDQTVVIACGAESTKLAVDFAVHAAKCGADAVMAAPPVTVALDDEALWGYYCEIIERATVPVVVQDASGYIGAPLSIALQVRLLDTYGAAVYFKPEAPPIGARLSALRDASGGEARIFEGSGGACLLDSYRRGVVGSMPGAEVCWAVQALWDSLVAGDWDMAYAINGPLTSLVALQPGLDGFIAVEKYLLVRQGVLMTADSRGPLSFRLDRETCAEVDRLCELLRLATDAAVARR